MRLLPNHSQWPAAFCGAAFATPWWRCALALLLCAVTWLALVPLPPKLLSTGWDKLNHLLAFSVLAVVAAMGFAAAWWRIAAALLAYGGLIEILQAFLPPRGADLADLLTDGLGIAVGLLLAQGMRRVALSARPGARSRCTRRQSAPP
jgi:VanZ family protein